MEEVFPVPSKTSVATFLQINMKNPKRFSEVIQAFITQYNDYDYLLAECNYGHIGVEDAIYAKRKIGETEWQTMNTFSHDPKQPCATLYVFRDRNYNYSQNSTKVTKKELLKIVTKLGI